MSLFWIVKKKQNFSMIYNSVLPTFNFLTDEIFDQISIKKDEIVYLLRIVNPNKALMESSGQMLLVCDDSVGMPLKIILKIF